MNPISLEGKVAVVTGGAGGIGRGIAESFAQLGARVIVADSNAESVSRLNEESRDRGWAIEAVECNVTKTAPVRALMKRVQDREQRLDILVNNVGDTLRLYKPFEEMTDENIDDLFGILLRHVMVCTREAIPLIKGSGDGGSIISISSIEGYRGLPNIVPYAAFKLGIEGFTKSLALELGPFGIRVNSIAPETTESESIRPSRWIKPGERSADPSLDPPRTLWPPQRYRGMRGFSRQFALRMGHGNHSPLRWRQPGRRGLVSPGRQPVDEHAHHRRQRDIEL